MGLDNILLCFQDRYMCYVSRAGLAMVLQILLDSLITPEHQPCLSGTDGSLNPPFNPTLRKSKERQKLWIHATQTQ